MNIAFVSGNREKLPNAVVPVGLLYIMAATPDRHDKTLIDLCFEDEPNAVLRDGLKDLQPDLVAISMRNIQRNDYGDPKETVDYYAGLVEDIRAASSAKVVLGGSGFSVMPEELMQHIKPDFGISGEGEFAFPKLLEALEDGNNGLDEIGALHYWHNDEVVANTRPAGFLDMTTLPFPDKNLIDQQYFADFGIDSIQTKRGCSMHCDYCVYPMIEGRKMRMREPKEIVDEMFAALETDPAPDHFFLVDSVFNLPPKHAKAVCREMISRNWQVPWTCYVNPLFFDAEFAGLAIEANCAGMEVGSDSGSDRVLEKLRKGFKLEHIRRFHDIATETGIKDCHTFILGTDSETIEDVQETLDFIVDLDPHSTIINIWFDDLESLQPERRIERVKLRADIEALLLSEKYTLPNWSVPGLGINFDEKRFAALRRAGYRGPLWQHMRRAS